MKDIKTRQKGYAQKNLSHEGRKCNGRSWGGGGGKAHLERLRQYTPQSGQHACLIFRCGINKHSTDNQHECQASGKA